MFSFDFSQIEHSSSFQINGLDFTIILIMMLLTKKPCF